VVDASGSGSTRLLLTIMATTEANLEKYDNLFHGQRVMLSELQQECPVTLAAVDMLIASERVVGQHLLFNQREVELYTPRSETIQEEPLKPERPRFTKRLIK